MAYSDVFQANVPVPESNKQKLTPSVRAGSLEISFIVLRCGKLAYVNIAASELNEDDRPWWNLYYTWQVIAKF